MASRIRLKRDALGTIERLESDAGPLIARRPTEAAPGLKRVAARLARREQRALAQLKDIDGVPRSVMASAREAHRTYIPGWPMHAGPPPSQHYFRAARHLLRQIHRRGVTHNDLAKEGNWLTTADGGCAIIDFQLACCFRRRGRFFRLLAREDIRHLLKHKNTYVPDSLTTREQRLLSLPSLPARLWKTLVKPVYRIVTLRILNWPERQGPIERGISADALQTHVAAHGVHKPDTANRPDGQAG